MHLYYFGEAPLVLMRLADLAKGYVFAMVRLLPVGERVKASGEAG